MKNLIIIESWLPMFEGFYNSHLSYHNEESDIEYYNEENNTSLNYDDFNFDYSEYRLRIAKKVTKVIETHLKDILSLSDSFKIEFQELRSPKHYNFETDSVNCKYTLTPKDFTLIRKYLSLERTNFEKYLVSRLQSRDGFISYYSADYHVWVGSYFLSSYEGIGTTFASPLNFILENEKITFADIAGEAKETENYINYTVEAE